MSYEIDNYMYPLYNQQMRSKLKGSSGVSILFKNVKGIKVVRKQSEKKEQIERLKVQHKKHLFLSEQKNEKSHLNYRTLGAVTVI